MHTICKFQFTPADQIECIVSENSGTFKTSRQITFLDLTSRVLKISKSNESPRFRSYNGIGSNNTSRRRSKKKRQPSSHLFVKSNEIGTVG